MSTMSGLESASESDDGSSGSDMGVEMPSSSDDDAHGAGETPPFMADAEELNEAADGLRGGVVLEKSHLCVWITIALHRLQFSSEQLKACGLDESKDIAVLVDFSSTMYTASTQPATISKVVQTAPSTELEGMKELDDETHFGLACHWPMRTTEPRTRAYVLAKAACCSVAQAQSALDKCPDYNMAFNSLLAASSAATSTAAVATAKTPAAASKADVVVVDGSSSAGGAGGGAGAGAGASASAAVSAPPSLPLLRRQSSDTTRWHAVRREEYVMSKHNPLFTLIHVVEASLKHCCEKCVVCDKQLDFAGRKPAVCGEKQCVFSYEDLGLGMSLAASLIHNPEVVDLHITLIYAAAYGPRAHLQFPLHVSFTDKDTGVTHTFTQYDKVSKKEVANTAKLREVLSLVPAVSVMTAWAKKGRVELRTQLQSLHPLLSPLLRWVLSSCRAHIRRMKPEEIIDGLPGCVQFVMLSGPQEREHVFQDTKAVYGSTHLFHGSGLGNWHSILRTGLKNMSQTKYMSTGAAYGNGIYFANQLGTSWNYMQGGTVWPLSRYGASLRLAALCEVVNNKKEFTHSSADINVVANENYVATRHLLLFDSTSQSTSVTASKLVIRDHSH